MMLGRVAWMLGTGTVLGLVLTLFARKVSDMVHAGLDQPIEVDQAGSLEMFTLQNCFNQLITQVAQSQNVIAEQNADGVGTVGEQRGDVEALVVDGGAEVAPGGGAGSNT